MSKKSAENTLLSKALFEQGYSALATLNCANEILEKFSVKEDSVSKALAMMIRTHSKLQGTPEAQTWNIENFSKAILQKNDELQWDLILSKLDQADFMLYDATGLKMLILFWSCNKDEPFPVQIFLQPWMHVRGQLSVLYQMVNAPVEVLDMNQSATKRVIPEDLIPTLPISMRQAVTQLASQQLNCLDLLEAIMDLAGTVASDDVRILMDRLAIQSPELLFIGLAKIQPIKNELHRTLLPKLLNMFLIGHANSPLVLRLLWHIQPNLLLEGFFELYRNDPTTVSRILDIAQEAKIVVQILKADVPFFTLDLASLAARRQNLNLEKWLMERLVKDGFVFFGACIDFLEKKCAIEMARQSGANVIPTLQLSMEVIKIFFRVLSDRPLPPPETAKLAKLSQLYTQLYPQLNEKGALENKPAEPPAENERNYSEEVENMVRLYFEKLYNGEISASRFASVLKSCRTSNDERQVHFFACTSHTLLDEARFFNQYPEDELIATGELLGLLIDQHLISYAQLRVTLKLILDALKYPVNSKMFNFGIQALAQFRDRLSEWPQYTLLLSKIEGLRSFPTIVESIATTLKQLAQKDPEGRMMASPKMGNAEALEHEAPNVTTLLQSTSNPTFENPSEKIQERVSFLINNLSANNLKSKSTELKHLLQKPTWGWFSHYLVVRRVSIEPNNHELYSTLLDELEMSTLTDAVIEETYVNINLLLQSEGIVDSSSDRNLLKNLGSWLGRLTIAKNRPIRHKDLSIKDLLLAAYDQNRLVVSIPLVCKILQHACNSKIFKLPNPWLMGSLKFLAELYWTEGLKLNLKFEIEILYKTLDLDLNEIEPTSLLENRGPPGIARSPAPPPPPSSSDATTAGASANSGTGGAADIAAAAVATAMTSPVKPFNQDVAPPPGPPPMTSIATPPGVLQPENRPDIDVTPILNKLQVNPAIAQLMIQHPIIKTTVYAGVSEAFQEVVPANIVTSANIAAISTKEMILKDFATEPDETRVQRAAHAMVQPLASSLAVVTCKEPLCNAIVTLIRTNLTQNGLPEQLADEIASTIATENIKLLCVYIDQLTQARALEDVERNLAPAYASRVNYRKQHQRGGAPFFDVLSLNGAPHTVQLPEALRPSHGISPEQFRLYEGFDQRTYMQQASPMGYHPEAVGPPPPFVGNEPQSSPAMPNANGNMLGAKLEQMLLELDRLVRQAGIHSISQLPPTHDICLLIRQIPLLISQSPSPGQTMLAFVEKVVFMLYQSSSPFALEVYTMFLQSLFEISGEAMKETLSWLIYADDERKYNPAAVSMFIRYDLLPMEEYDTQLAKLIHAKADGVIEFAANLMRICLLSQTPISFLEDHILTISALYKLEKNEEAPTNVSTFIHDLKVIIEKPYESIQHDLNCLELRMLLAEWVRLCQHPMATDALFHSLSQKVMQVTETDDGRYFFFRLCTENCVNHYLSFRSVSSVHHRRMIHMIDSFTKLISAMVLEEASDKNKIKLLNDALSVMILVLSYHHENRGIEFNQKPFLRLFASLFNEISKIRTNTIDTSALITFSDALYTLQPINFPGFAFSWLQLISCRSFLPQLLVANENNGWMMCQKLIHALLKFLSPLLNNQELPRATKMFYRGTLRVLVVLLHDFPEFLCNNYIIFAQAIPHSCVQLRNLILSAFPRVMHLPDPFTPDLILELLPESAEEPVFDQSYANILEKDGFKDAIDRFVETKDASFYETLEKHVTSNRSEILCAFVLYIGAKSTMIKPLEENPAILCYTHLLSKMESESRYTLLSAIADHLRYPNSHTCFFSATFLHIFAEQSELVKEQITRVLLERLIVNRPHPWGLLASFIELIKNPSFWKHDFIRCSPDIERLFDNVSSSIKRTERVYELLVSK